MTMLPGADIVERGLRDLAAKEETVDALLVALAAPRLRALGLNVPPTTSSDPRLSLYRLLQRDNPDDAHGRFNALVRRLVSFERAMERERFSQTSPVLVNS